MARRETTKTKHPDPWEGMVRKLDVQLIRKIADHVKHGVPRRPAAVACGVPEALFYGWLEGGNLDLLDGKSNLTVKLVLALDKAEAEYEASQHMIATRAAIGYRNQEGDAVEGDHKAAIQNLDKLDKRKADDRLALHRKLTTY